MVNPDESARYIAQENINVAQVLIMDGQLSLGIDELEKNVNFCRQECNEYLGEALSALAYGYFVTKDYFKSALNAEMATIRISAEASPSRLRAAREIQIASMARMSDEVGAVSLLDVCEMDPLGLTLSPDVN